MARAGFALAGLGIVCVAVVGFGVRHSLTGHTPVGPWDYEDRPNSQPIEHPGAEMPLPQNVIHARNGTASADGIIFHLVGLSKGNTMNPDHFWAPSGGPLEEDLPWPRISMPDQPENTDGRYRELAFTSSGGERRTDVSITGYVPDGARQGLSIAEKMRHGWGFDQYFQPGQVPPSIRTHVFVDDPTATRFMLVVASGEWKPIGDAKNELSKPPYLDRIAAQGPWGNATVTQAMSESHRSSSFPGGFAF